MITLQYALAAQRLVRDAQTNSVSAFDILEELQSPSFPLMLQRLDAIAVFEREEGDPRKPKSTVSVKLDTKLLFEGDLTVDFDNVLRTRSFLSFAGLVIPGPGTINIEFIVAGEKKGFVNIPVQAVSLTASSLKQDAVAAPTT